MVLYTNFFIYGHSVWDPLYKDSQILASDVNCDGAVLTIADLITLIRILTGDQQPIDCPDPSFPKIAADGGTAQIVVSRDATGLSIGVISEVDLGGVYVALAASSGRFGAIQWMDEFAGMTKESRVTEEEARVILLPEDRSAGLSAGQHMLFHIPLSDDADYRIVETQAAGFDGAVISTDLIEAGAAVPDEYSLDQNYPHPFNAGTVISFNLPQISDWELTVFNILGQSVRRFSGSGDLGRVNVSWDGRREDGEASGTGIYFARLVTGQFKASRKMLLIK